jgi:hypothetical protein
MATDYDSPRKTDDELTEDSLQELQARRMDKSSTVIDLDPDDVAESLELPGADLSNEELSFRVIPVRQTSSPVRVASWYITGASSPRPVADSLSAGSARPNRDVEPDVSDRAGHRPGSEQPRRLEARQGPRPRALARAAGSIGGRGRGELSS